MSDHLPRSSRAGSRQLPASRRCFRPPQGEAPEGGAGESNGERQTDVRAVMGMDPIGHPSPRARRSLSHAAARIEYQGSDSGYSIRSATLPRAHSGPVSSPLGTQPWDHKVPLQRLPEPPIIVLVAQCVHPGEVRSKGGPCDPTAAISHESKVKPDRQRCPTTYRRAHARAQGSCLPLAVAFARPKTRPQRGERAKATARGRQSSELSLGWTWSLGHHREHGARSATLRRESSTGGLTPGTRFAREPCRMPTKGCAIKTSQPWSPPAQTSSQHLHEKTGHLAAPPPGPAANRHAAVGSQGSPAATFRAANYRSSRPMRPPRRGTEQRGTL